jgi:hypothetical protein
MAEMLYWQGFQTVTKFGNNIEMTKTPGARVLGVSWPLYSYRHIMGVETSPTPFATAQGLR